MGERMGARVEERTAAGGDLAGVARGARRFREGARQLG